MYILQIGFGSISSSTDVRKIKLQSSKVLSFPNPYTVFGELVFFFLAYTTFSLAFRVCFVETDPQGLSRPSTWKLLALNAVISVLRFAELSYHWKHDIRGVMSAVLSFWCQMWRLDVAPPPLSTLEPAGTWGIRTVCNGPRLLKRRLIQPLLLCRLLLWICPLSCVQHLCNKKEWTAPGCLTFRVCHHYLGSCNSLAMWLCTTGLLLLQGWGYNSKGTNRML